MLELHNHRGPNADSEWRRGRLGVPPPTSKTAERTLELVFVCDSCYFNLIMDINAILCKENS